MFKRRQIAHVFAALIGTAGLSACSGTIDWGTTELYQLKLSGDLLQAHSSEVGAVIPATFEAKLFYLSSGEVAAEPIAVSFIAYSDAQCTQRFGDDHDKSGVYDGPASNGTVSFFGKKGPDQPMTAYIRAEGQYANPSECSAPQTFIAGPPDRFSLIDPSSSLVASNTSQLFKVRVTDRFGNPVPIPTFAPGSKIDCVFSTGQNASAGSTPTCADTSNSEISTDGIASCSCVLPNSGPQLINITASALGIANSTPIKIAAGPANLLRLTPLLETMPAGTRGFAFLDAVDYLGNRATTYASSVHVVAPAYQNDVTFDTQRDAGSMFIDLPSFGAASPVPVTVTEAAGQGLGVGLGAVGAGTTAIPALPGSANFYSTDLGCSTSSWMNVLAAGGFHWGNPASWSPDPPTLSDSVDLSNLNELILDADPMAKCLRLSNANLANSAYGRVIKLGSYLEMNPGSSIYTIATPSASPPPSITLEVENPVAQISLQQSTLNITTLSFTQTGQVVWIGGGGNGGELITENLQAAGNTTLVVQGRLRVLNQLVLNSGWDIRIAPGGVLVLEGGAQIYSGSIWVGPGGAIEVGKNQTLVVQDGNLILKGSSSYGPAQIRPALSNAGGYAIQVSGNSRIDWENFSIRGLDTKINTVGIDFSAHSGFFHAEQGEITSFSTTNTLIRIGKYMTSRVLSRINISGETPEQISVAANVFDVSALYAGNRFLLDEVSLRTSKDESLEDFLKSNSVYLVGDTQRDAFVTSSRERR